MNRGIQQAWPAKRRRSLKPCPPSRSCRTPSTAPRAPSISALPAPPSAKRCSTTTLKIEHACDMSCACTTCHVVVREGFNSLNELDRERRRPARPRLGPGAPVAPESCQAILAQQDLTVEIPVLHQPRPRAPLSPAACARSFWTPKPPACRPRTATASSRSAVWSCSTASSPATTCTTTSTPSATATKTRCKVHGISNEFLRDKPKFAEVADDLLDYLQGCRAHHPQRAVRHGLPQQGAGAPGHAAHRDRWSAG
jgi:ferredoxin, 2Fe-2S